MSKQSMAKPARPGRLRQVEVNSGGTHSEAIEGDHQPAGRSAKPELILRGADLGDGFYVVQFTDKAIEKLNSETSSLQFSSQHLRHLPKMNEAEMVDVIARIKRRSIASRPEQEDVAGPVSSTGNMEFLEHLSDIEQEDRAELEESGQLLDSQRLAAMMGVTRQAINKAESELRMFSLDGIAGKKLYPAFFADSKIDRRAIQKVSKALEQLAGSSKWQFFTNPRVSLGKKTPVEALRKGKVEQVLAAAIAFREA